MANFADIIVSRDNISMTVAEMLACMELRCCARTRNASSKTSVASFCQKDSKRLC